MNLKKYFRLVLLCFSTSTSYAQQKEVIVPIQIRAVLHDPVHPTAKLFFLDKVGIATELELLPLDFSRPILTQLVNGSLVFYDKAAIDPKKPEDSLAATCKIPIGMKQGVVVILPSPVNSKPPYRLVFIDDSAKSFPKGESRMLTLLPMEAAIEAGEHKVAIHPGEIAFLPPVKKVNPYNMAQTNFYFKQEQTWTVFSQSQLQYLDGFRRVFIIYNTPKALQPTFASIVDTTSPTAPLLTR
jgi:hypothetical protein